jgi:hypothetical protein
MHSTCVGICATHIIFSRTVRFLWIGSAHSDVRSTHRRSSLHIFVTGSWSLTPSPCPWCSYRPRMDKHRVHRATEPVVRHAGRCVAWSFTSPPIFGGSCHGRSFRVYKRVLSLEFRAPTKSIIPRITTYKSPKAKKNLHRQVSQLVPWDYVSLTQHLIQYGRRGESQGNPSPGRADKGE